MIINQGGCLPVWAVILTILYRMENCEKLKFCPLGSGRMALPFSMFASVAIMSGFLELVADIDPSVHYVDFNKRLDGKFPLQQVH